MARIGAALKVNRATLGQESFSGVVHISDPHNSASFDSDRTAFEAALTTLVADGASPTQAHVTAVNNAYTTLKGDFGVTPAVSDVTLSIDTTKVPSITVLRQVLDRLLATLSATSYFTR